MQESIYGNWKHKLYTIWSGQIFSVLTSATAQFALVLWIGTTLGSAKVLALATIAGLLPQIILGPFAGVYVDRWNKKKVLILSDSFVAFCSAIIGILYYLDMLGLGAIYFLLALRSVGGAFHSVAMKSCIPLLAPSDNLVKIAGVNQVIQSISLICGPALGAFLLINYDLSIIMFLDVLGASIACIAVALVRIPESLVVKRTFSVVDDLQQGARVILKNKPMSWLIGSEVLSLFVVFPVIAITPLLTLNYYHATAYQVSLIEIAFGIGLLFGAFLLTYLSKLKSPYFLILFGYITLGLALIICGLLPSEYFGLYGAFVVLQGIAVPLYEGSVTALIQREFPAKYLGRIFGLIASVCQIPAVVGLLFTSVFAQDYGVQYVYILAGIVLCLCGFIVKYVINRYQVENSSKQDINDRSLEKNHI